MDCGWILIGEPYQNEPLSTGESAHWIWLTKMGMKRTPFVDVTRESQRKVLDYCLVL